MAMADGEKEEPASSGAGAGTGTGTGRMNLNEYMVAVDRPLGVRFALAVDGRVFVHSLMRGVSYIWTPPSSCYNCSLRLVDLMRITADSIVTARCYFSGLEGYFPLAKNHKCTWFSFIVELIFCHFSNQSVLSGMIREVLQFY